MHQSVFAYIYLAHTAFCVSIWWGSYLRNEYAYHTNPSMPATISWWLFAHFRTRKHAASMGLRHARMNISAGLSNAYATPSILSHSQQPYSYTICRLLLTLLFQTHPPLPFAKRLFNVARQCYFDMKANKEPYFSILSIIILWSRFYYGLSSRTTALHK